MAFKAAEKMLHWGNATGVSSVLQVTCLTIDNYVLLAVSAGERVVNTALHVR